MSGQRVAKGEAPGKGGLCGRDMAGAISQKRMVAGSTGSGSVKVHRRMNSIAQSRANVKGVPRAGLEPTTPTCDGGDLSTDLPGHTRMVG